MKILPFNFERINDTYVLLTNIAGESIFLSNSDFEAICVVGGKNGELTEFAPPCGVCRQVMMEFCNPETFKVILATSEEHYEEHSLKELLPLGFGPGNLA